MKSKKLMQKRLVAMLIDIAFIALLITFFAVIFIVADISLLWLAVVTLVFSLLYFTAFEGSSLNATPGMYFMKLWLVYDNDNGKLMQAFIRTLTGIFTCIPFFFGFWYGFMDKNGKTVYDYLFSVKVVTFGERPEPSNKKPCILRKRSNGEYKKIFIPKGGLVFGREENTCNVLFSANEPGVSRCHCALQYNRQANMFLLQDLNSKFGTYLGNGKPVQPGKFCILNDGDKFYLGSESNEFIVTFKERNND